MAGLEVFFCASSLLTGVEVSDSATALPSTAKLETGDVVKVKNTYQSVDALPTITSTDDGFDPATFPYYRRVIMMQI